ncbi:peptidoglycan-binding protein [Arcanobacterium haemolyticum]|nr:peptidoglycan-binding protein [Arcanobacterium haemolyticum]
MNLLRRILLITLIAVFAGAAGWWARGIVVDRTETTVTTEQLPPETADVVHAKVGKTYNFGTTISRQFAPVAVNHFEGIVTWLAEGPVTPGQPIYQVSGESVYAIGGSEPFFRELARDVEGEDVRQLQTFLADAGYLRTAVDGKFGAATESAVKSWQKAEKLEQTGVIELGRIVALPHTPAPVVFVDNFTKGMPAPVGEAVFKVPAGEPRFVLRLSETQMHMVPIGSTVQVKYEGHMWSAVASHIDESAYSETDELVLATPDGNPVICGDECDILPASAEFTTPSVVEVSAPIEGAAVPVAAIITRADSTAFVVIDGAEREVTVRGSGSGLAVIEGAEIGETVELPRSRADASSSITTRTDEPSPKPEPPEDSQDVEGNTPDSRAK